MRILAGKEAVRVRIPYHPRRPELEEKPTGTGLEQVFRRAADFQRRRLKLRGGGWAELYWLNGMVRTERLNDYVIRPLTLLPLEGKPVDAVRSGGVWASEVSTPETLEQAATALTEGAVRWLWTGSCCLSRCPPRKSGVWRARRTSPT